MGTQYTWSSSGRPCATQCHRSQLVDTAPGTVVTLEETEGGGWSIVEPTQVKKVHFSPGAQRGGASTPGLPGAVWGPGWVPGDGVCCSSPCTATVSAWQPDALHRPPRTPPGSAGVSRPRPQLSSKDPSSKSRSFTCSLTGRRRVEELLEPAGWL